MMSSTVDGNDDCESVAHIFSDKYSMLYTYITKFHMIQRK